MNLVIGIISYLPSEQMPRTIRIEAFNHLQAQLNQFFPSVPVIVIAQNWQDYTITSPNYTIHSYPKLGILRARKTLRQKLLKSNGDYFILFDDDAIIEMETSTTDLLQMCGENPNGFAFRKGDHNKYNPCADSQLNFAVLSRFILESEDVPNVDPQKDEGFEDRVWSMLLHVKYAQYEWELPTDIKCTHFHKEGVPSTWARECKRDWKRMRSNTECIEKYIIVYKDLPRRWK